jgi:hypothetical protein
MNYINKNRQVAPSCCGVEIGIKETMSKSGIRRIDFVNRPDQFQQYLDLSRLGLTTLNLNNDFYTKTSWEGFSLEVPRGAILLSNQLFAISNSNNVELYIDLFVALGDYIANIIKKAKLTPDYGNRPILDLFLMYASDSDRYGINVELAPPFILSEISDETQDLQDIVNLVKDDLVKRQLFNSEQIELLIDGVRLGIELYDR